MQQIEISSQDSGHWQSVNDAMTTLGISRRTLYQYMNKGKVHSKKEGKYRFIWVDDETIADLDSANNISDAQHSKYTDDTLNLLSEQIEYLQGQNSKLQEQIEAQSERHDSIVLGLANTVSEQKLELHESKSELTHKVEKLQEELKAEKSKGLWRRIFNF